MACHFLHAIHSYSFARVASVFYFLAWVTVEDEEGNESRHRIVGADEFDQHEQFITVDSPLAKILLGKTIDDEVYLERQGTKQALYVVHIEYEN